MRRGFRNFTLSLGALSIIATPLFGTLPVHAAEAKASSAETKMSSVEAKTASPIKHTIVIFQENRTFDNYFGTYPYAPGFKPLNGTPQDVRNFKYVTGNVTRDANGAVYNPDVNGNPIYPWHDAGKADIQETDVNHGYSAMISMVDGGKMDKFYQVNHDSGKTTDTNDKGLLSMSYFDYNDIPAYWQYAQHYALADNYFQPVYGPSTPGALYLVAAQSGNGSEPASNTNPNSQITGDPSPKNGPFGGDSTNGLTYNLTYPNIGDELSATNQSWAWYAGGWDAAKADPTSDEAKKYSPHHNPFQYFQNYEDGKYSNNLKDYNKFAQDIASGNLPAVSFIKAGYGDDEHPGTGNQSTPSAEEFTVDTINEIMNSPYWKDTAIIVTYDEGGGFYDHVAPNSIAPNKDGLLGNGPRIPALVISPYAKENYVSHVQYDHSSILKFLEWNYKLPALNSKDATANNMLDMFDFDHPNFLPYMYNDGDLTNQSANGTAVKVRLNNALLGVSHVGEAPFVDSKGNVMVPLDDFARSVNGSVTQIKENRLLLQTTEKQIEWKVQGNTAFVDGKPIHLETNTWKSPTGITYIPLQSAVDILGWSMDTQGDTVTVTSK
ncbi:alkaline phosphatase family protein [Ectobacillus funiculus]|uniref:alkaline phosphatase family protein n=1 Tax=Ectobacillus funiculus TaxID=137993 RepID=UPI00101C9C2A|nr:alkaline phosphatase family protein [Ectobacillus funiculus]